MSKLASASPAPSLRALHRSATFFFIAAVIGQLAFAFYLAVFYGGAALRGDLPAWNKVMPHGYVSGDSLGNSAVALHLAGALILILTAVLQFLPQIRQRAPRLHRISGRVYLLSASLASLSGIYMIWTRGTVGDLSQHLATTLNGLVTLTCAAFVLRRALERNFVAHRRWALRLFLAASGVWFFRLGLMLCFFIFRAPVGFDPKTFTGPFLTALAYSQFLLPLALLEIYFYAQERGSASFRWLSALGLTVLTLVMSIGIFAATMGLWLPRIR